MNLPHSSRRAGSRRDVLRNSTGAALCAALSTGRVVAQATYPERAIRFVAPFSAGSASDILARAVAERLHLVTRQPVIVENRPGAGGTIGTALVARAEPDGHTLVVVSAGHVVNPAIYRSLPYDTLRDLSGVIPFASLPSVLVVPGNAPYRTVQDLGKH